MTTTYNTPFGKMDCYENYLIFSLAKTGVNKDSAKQIMKYAYDHYQKRKFVFISNRKFVSGVKPEAYKAINSKYTLGFAIVSNDINVKQEALNEQLFFEGSFSFFTTEAEAIDWANTVVKSENLA